MRQDVRHQIWIAAIAIAVFFANLGATRLWDQDEAFFARAAVEMHQRGDWVVPYFNGEVFAHKPPFMFWMMRFGFELFGVTEFAARFWSAVFATGTALLTYQIGRRLFNANVGLWAGIAMSTTTMFGVVGRAATPDSFLVFFCTLSLYVFARKENWQPNAGSEQTPSPPLSWQSCVTIYAVMALAVLVKGPIGILLPGCTIGLYLLVRHSAGRTGASEKWSDRAATFLFQFSPTRLAQSFWQMRPFTAVAAVLLVAGPWYAMVGWRTGGSFLSQFFGEQNFGRFVNAMDNHSGGIWYYLPAILVGFFPWSIFTIPTVLNLVQQMRPDSVSSRGAKFLACWTFVWIGFFSIASTKLPNYVLPAYPALALATGCLLSRWQRTVAMKKLWPRLSFASLAAVGLTIAIAAPVLAYAKSNGQPLVEKLGVSPELTRDFAQLGWLGAVLAVGGIACLAFIELNRTTAALRCFTVTAPVFCLFLFAVLAVQFDRHQPSPTIAKAIQQNAVGSPQVAQFGYFRPSLVYYSDTRVEPCKTVPSVIEFLNRSDNSFLVTTETHYNRLAAELPGDVLVLDREPEFPRAGTVIVLGRQPKVALRQDAEKN
jgi:4-amino-4-deoxy-L-arabinose transferase-like glycosyltransferase